MELYESRGRAPFEGFTPPRQPAQDPGEGSSRSLPAPSSRDRIEDPVAPLHPCPEARKLPFSAIPKEWNILEPGFVLGQQPNTLVLPDGRVWGPDMVEVDESTYVVPLWRMRKLNAPSRKPTVILPVREAYDSLASFFAEAPTFATEWVETNFHPPGSTSSRALELDLQEAEFMPAFFSQVSTWFQGLAARDAGKQVEKKKALWEEATSPSNFIPRGIGNLAPAEYVAFLAEPEFSRSQAAIELNARRLPKVPANIPKEEHKARTMLLSQLNNAIGAEALALRLGPDSSVSPSAKALAKGTLLSLWQAFHSFAIKKLAFRKKATKGCFGENVMYQRLISGNPFTPSLFDPQTVKEIMDQAAHQTKPALQILGYVAPFKRPADPLPLPRAKKAKPSVAVSSQQGQDQAGSSRHQGSQQQDRSRSQHRPQHQGKSKRSSGNRRRRDRPTKSVSKGAGPSKSSDF